MGLGISDAIEVASDVLGGISGVALLVPTYRITKIREVIHSKRGTLDQVDPADSTGMKKRWALLEEAAAEFEPRDTLWLRVGVWALVAAFGLKLLFHATVKFGLSF